MVIIVFNDFCEHSQLFYDLFVSLPALGIVPCSSGAFSLTFFQLLAIFLSSRCEIEQIQIMLSFHLGSPWSKADVRQRRRVAGPLFAICLRGILLGGLAEGFSSRVSSWHQGLSFWSVLMVYLHRSICTPDIGPCSPEGDFKKKLCCQIYRWVT